MLVLALGSIGLAAPCAQARLLPTLEDLPGATATSPARALVRQELAGARGARLGQALNGATSEIASFRVAGARVTLAAFVLPSAVRAKAAVGTWARAKRATRVGLGDGAARRSSAVGGRATVVVVVRVGSGLGLVRYERSRRGRESVKVAMIHARQLAATMAAELSLAPFDRAVARALADRVVTKTEALRVFGLAFGGLPGYPADPAQREPVEGTLPVRWIRRFRDRLPAKLRKAVDARIGGPGQASARALARRSATRDETLTLEAREFARLFLDRLGYDFPGGLLPLEIVVYRSAAPAGSVARAHTDPVNAAGVPDIERPVTCRILWYPSADTLSAEGRRHALAHETFHCVQYSLLIGRELAPWVAEGTADWAATQVTTADVDEVGGQFARYLASPSDSVLTRAYDAIGLFGALNQHLGTIWPRMVGTILATSDEAAFAAAGGTDVGFPAVWASGLLRRDAAQPAWFVAQPWAIPESRVSSPQVPISGNVVVGVGAHANKLARVVIPGERPLVELLVTGAPGRVNDGNQDLIVNGSSRFCATGRCVCPPGQIASFPRFTEIEPEFDFALSGWTGSSLARFEFLPIDEFCRPPDDPDEEGSGAPSGSGGSVGEPHIYSLDGLSYDLMAAGEFVLVRSVSGDLEVQVRFEPFEAFGSLTATTQAGFRVGGKRVVVSPGSPMSVVADGRRLPPGATASLRGGTVEHGTRGSGYALIAWPDGSLATVSNAGAWVDVVVTLAQGRRHGVRGLLGNFDGDPANDLVTRNGSPLPYTAVPYGGSDLGKSRIENEGSPTFQAALYDVFSDSWRIAQRESLLAYRRGESTRTFTDRTIPRRQYDRGDLPSRVRRIAERLCRDRGVSDPAILEDCILDVGATGNVAFADSAARFEAAVALGWRRLAWGSNLSGDVELARLPDGSLQLAAAEADPATDARRLTSGHVGPDAREGPASVISETADLVSNAHLTVAPDGSLLATVAGSDPATGALGTFGFTSAPPYTAWSPRRLIAQGGATFGGEAVSLFAPDATQLTVSPGDGRDTRIFLGFAATPPAPETSFTSPAADLPGCGAASPALAAEAGAVWLAWVQWQCPLRGLYVARLDPAQIGTANGVVTASRALAPDSFWPGASPIDYPNIGYFDRVAMASRPGQPGTFVVYPSYAGGAWRVLLWRVGDPAPVEVARTRVEPRVPMVSAEPTSGRLWVAWTEGGRLFVRQTARDGLSFPRPSGEVRIPFDAIGRWSISARDGVLDIVFASERTGSRPGEVWLGSLQG